MAEQVNKLAFGDFYQAQVDYRDEKGLVRVRDVDMIRIRWAGNTKNEFHAPANDRSDRYELLPDKSKNWLTWKEVFPKEWEQYAAKQTQRASGVPLEKLPFLTRAQTTELERHNIFTVEQVLAVDGPALSKIGLDIRSIKQQAGDYMKRMEGVSQDVQFRAEIARRDEQLATMQAQIDALTAGQGKAAPKAVAAKAAEAEEEVSTSPFASWEDADIRTWIAEAAPGEAPPHHKLGHDKLVKFADDLNARLQKARQAVAA